MADRADPSAMRLSVVGIVCVSLFAALFARLWYLQVIDQSEYDRQASAVHLRVIHEEGTRGRILDRNGKVLVDNRVSLVVGLDHLQLKHTSNGRLKKMFDSLADTLTSFGHPTKSPTISALFNDKRYGPTELVPIAEDITPDLELYLAEHASEFPGVVVKRKAVRTYPYGSLAAHIVGYVGQINQAELDARKGTGSTTTSSSTANAPAAGSVAAKPYEPGDEIGKGGVEATFEPYLRGVPADRTIQVDARGDYITTTKEADSRPGDDVWLTIDLNLQAYAEQMLAHTLDGIRGSRDKNGNVLNAPQGSVVITDPRNGQILAMASAPTYDPSLLVNGISSDLWAQLNDKAAGRPLFNWALQGTYAPGSTFKLFTATAGLKTGFLHPGNDHFNDTGSYKVGGCRGGKCSFSNAGGSRYGYVDVTRAITVSSDVFFYWLGDGLWQQRTTVGDTAIQDAAATYGLGAKSGVALPGESSGRLPTPEWLRRLHQTSPKAFPRGTWTAGDNLNTAVGQGDVLATPLQLANAYGTFANGGTRYVPQIVAKITRPKDVGLTPEDPANWTLVQGTAVQAAGTVDLSPEQRNQIYTGLQGVVQSGDGTANSAYREHKPAFPMAGKTGTAQVKGKADTSVFVGFGPADGITPPEYAISVVIPEAGFGGDVAAPLAMSIMQPTSQNALPPVQPVTPAASPGGGG